ncbi:MAG: hypothetical protein ACI9HE_001812 [Planctomycetota bacterium]|jgi:hypothetical protein
MSPAPPENPGLVSGLQRDQGARLLAALIRYDASL